MDRRKLLILRKRASYQQRIKNLFGSSLVAYWPLDEASGTVARDVSGNNYHGSYIGVTVGGETNPITGKPCPVWSGANGKYVYLNSSGAVPNLNEGTVIQLCKPGTGIMAEAATRQLHYFRGSADNMSCGKYAAHSLFQGRYISSAYKIFKPFGYLKDNVWSLVISTWSRENNVGKIYINGNEATTTTNTTDTADIPVTILIGASGVSNESWSGNIGDTVLLNRYITPAESLQCFRIFLSDYSMWVGILGDSISTNSVGWHGGIFGTYNSNRTKINNHAVAGMGVIQGASNMAAQVTASASDRNNIIIIELGTNDDNAGNMTTLQASYEAGIIALKASNPLATIYALNVLPRWTDTGGGTVVDKSNIRTAIAAACTAQSITCWDTFTDPWITAAQTADGLHPTAAGHAAIAAQVLARL